MKISELIAKLQEIQAKHGDLRVWLDQYYEVSEVVVTTFGDLSGWTEGEEAKISIVQLT